MRIRTAQIFSCVLLIILITACARHARPGKQQLDIGETFEQLELDTSPDQLYHTFNEFCLTYFGARTDQIYDSLGKALAVKDEGHWTYFSERSATVAWETNLPAKTYVEYGETPHYGRRTGEPERYFFLHTHYLKDLKPETRYYYRLVSTDAYGRRVESAEKNFVTRSIAGAVYIPGDLGDPPFILDRPNARYVVTEDIIAPGTAIEISAENITLDLGGNTITHANELIPDLNYQELRASGVGIRRINNERITGLKIYNGVVRQGKAMNNQDYRAGDNMLKPDPERKKILDKNSNRGFSNIEITAIDDVEIAGITAIYHLPQTWGMRFDQPDGGYNIHHNVFLDKGTQMFNRHGAGGARSLGFSQWGTDAEGENDFQVHHNLVKRTRQNALNVAQKIFSNEIYVDSWVVNSFAVQPARQNAAVHYNKIFLTGYYACGILWASKDLSVHSNFIHMESVKTMIEPPEKGRRLLESWGEQDVLAGMRVTNYNKGGTERENLFYTDNIIFGRCRKGTEMRGTEFFSDYSNKNILFTNNTVKILVTDSLHAKAACVDTQGAFNDRTTHLPVHYRNSTLASNACNIRFGDAYGQGSNHRFIDCRIQTSSLKRANYHTFIFDGGSSVFNHELLDCDFGEETRYDDVYWENTGSRSNYSIKWTLNIEVNPGAEVTVTDRFGNTAYNDISTGEELSLALPQCIIRPVEWSDGAGEVHVTEKGAHQKETFSPYTVLVKFRDQQKSMQVNLDTKKRISMKL